MAATRSVHGSVHGSDLRSGYGTQPVDGYARRYDAPAPRGTSRYDAPRASATQRLDVPPARLTSYRAPSSHSGTTYDAPAARTGYGVRA